MATVGGRGSTGTVPIADQSSNLTNGTTDYNQDAEYDAKYLSR